MTTQADSWRNHSKGIGIFDCYAKDRVRCRTNDLKDAGCCLPPLTWTYCVPPNSKAAPEQIAESPFRASLATTKSTAARSAHMWWRNGRCANVRRKKKSTYNCPDCRGTLLSLERPDATAPRKRAALAHRTPRGPSSFRSRRHSNFRMYWPLR
jgi:hypothetical protein